MGIIHVRVDDRLIHGQVATLWLTSLGANRAMVVEENADDTLKMSLKLACPAGVALSVLPVEKAAERILAGKYDSQKVFIVAKSPLTVLQLVEKGVPIGEVNVGNLTYREGSRKLSNQVALTANDEAAFRSLNEKGVQLTLQLQPDKAVESLMKLMDKNR